MTACKIWSGWSRFDWMYSDCIHLCEFFLSACLCVCLSHHGSGEGDVVDERRGQSWHPHDQDDGDGQTLVLWDSLKESHKTDQSSCSKGIWKHLITNRCVIFFSYDIFFRNGCWFLLLLTHQRVATWHTEPNVPHNNSHSINYGWHFYYPCLSQRLCVFDKPSIWNTTSIQTISDGGPEPV